MTFSILGLDAERAELGLAVQSKFPGVGSIIAHGRAGVGVIATQAFANPDHGETGLDLLALGATPADVIEILTRRDGNKAQRQIAVLDPAGRQAQHTGAEVLDWDGWAGMAAGTHCLAHGNSLTGEAVVRRMVEVFETQDGDLATRLMAALAAGQAAGGELRGQQSAALLVVKEGGGYGGRSGRHVEISIYDHAQPIAELQRCYALHRLSYFPSDPDKLVPIDKDMARELKALLARQGYLKIKGEPTGTWDQKAIAAMQRFMGVENYDNRIRDDARIDLEVLDDIRARHGPTAVSP